MATEVETINTKTESGHPHLDYFYDRVNWQNNSKPALNAENLNKSDYALDLLLGKSGAVHSIISTVNQEIEARKLDVTAINSDLENVTQSTNQLNNSVNELNIDLETLQNNVTQSTNQLNNSVDAINTNITSNYYTKTEVNDLIDDIEVNVDLDDVVFVGGTSTS